jgi:hypothetical protein
MFVVASAICFSLGELNTFLQEARRIELTHYNQGTGAPWGGSRMAYKTDAFDRCVKIRRSIS